MVDMIGIPAEKAGARAKELAKMGVGYICVSGAFDEQGAGLDAVSEVQHALASARANYGCECELAVAGGIKPGHLPALMRHAPSVLVVGKHVTRSTSPSEALQELRVAAADAALSVSVEEENSSRMCTGGRHTVVRDLGIVVAEVSECAARVEQEEASALVDAILARVSSGRVLLAGAGRADCAVRGFAMRLKNLGIDAHVVGDTTTPPIHSGDLLIVGSGSGGSSELVVAAEKAKAVGADVVLVTIVAESPVGLLADAVVVIPAQSPEARVASLEMEQVASEQPMGALFDQTMALVFDAAVMALMKETGQDSSAMFARHTKNSE
jgi:6-phospho-3-hexuloisomerase